MFDLDFRLLTATFNMTTKVLYLMAFVLYSHVKQYIPWKLLTYLNKQVNNKH